jgi:hypothetical protein
MTVPISRRAEVRNWTPVAPPPTGALQTRAGPSVGFGIALLAVLVSFCVACSGSASPSAPTPPPIVTVQPTVQAINVTMPGLLVVGTSELGSATSTMSNGAVQGVSGSWSSDNNSVASVDSSGRVTPNANGRTFIRLTAAGIQGTREIRVVPNYQGRWFGQGQVIGCTQSGVWLQINACGSFPNGRTLSFTLTLTQATRDVVSGSFARGQLQGASFTIPVESDGAITFGAQVVGGPPGVATLTESWRVNSLTNGSLIGGLTERSVALTPPFEEFKFAVELRTMTRQ